MKSLLALGFAIASATSFALTALPEGKWEGKGAFTAETGLKGGYLQTVTIRNNVLTIEIDASGQKSVHVMSHSFDANGFTTVSIEDRAKQRTLPATGYCASTWCHLRTTDGTFEMTYVFDQGKLATLGSMLDEGVKGWFETSLVQVSK